MKKILIYSFIFVSTFLCTGCVKDSFDIEIDKNANISITEVKNVPISPISDNGDLLQKLEDELEEYAKKYKTKGFEVKSSLNDYYAGLILSRKNVKFKDALILLPVAFQKQDVEGFTKEKGILKDTYKVHLIYDITRNIAPINNEYNKLKYSSKIFNTYGEDFLNPVIYAEEKIDPETGKLEIKNILANGQSIIRNDDNSKVEEGLEYSPLVTEIVIKIPTKASYHNAKEVISDTEYKWVISSDNKKQEILIEYEDYKLAFIATILSIIILIFPLIKLYEKTKGENPINGF